MTSLMLHVDACQVHLLSIKGHNLSMPPVCCGPFRYALSLG